MTLEDDPRADLDAHAPRGASPSDGDAARSAEEVVALVSAAMEAHEAGGEAALQRFCDGLGRHSDEVRRRLEGLRRVGLLAAPTPPPTPARGPEPTNGRPPSGARQVVPERLGDFELIEPLGRGGMGVVYRARQVSLDREVAVKLIRPEQLYFPGVRERFQREVGIVARLQHEGIVRLYSFGEDDGIPWFAMERIVGCSLADVLQRLGGRDPRDLDGQDLARCLPGRVVEGPGAELFKGPWGEVVMRVVERAALALDEAHRQGVLHRDIKPSNIMLTASGRVVLLDFGLAWTATADALTRSGAELGTIHYMAPEQFRGAATEIDERTDVYALGVVLRELLTLRPVFTGTTIDVVARQVREGLTSPFGRRGSSGAFEVETVCLVAMDRDAERRYPSARALAKDLHNLLEHRPIAAVRPKLGLRLRRYAQRHPAVAAATSVAVVALLSTPVLVAVRERGLRVRLEQTNTTLAAEVQRADENLALASAALRSTLSRVSDAELVEVPDLAGLVDGLLTDSGSFLDALAATNPTDPATRIELAETLLVAARTRWQFFDLPRTEPVFARVLTLLEGVTIERDRVDALALEARLSLVFIRRQYGAVAVPVYEEALASVADGGPYSSRPVEVRVFIARALERCGDALSRLADARGRAMMLESMALREANCVEQPTAECWLEVAIGARALAEERSRAGDPEGAAGYAAAQDRAMWEAHAAARTAPHVEKTDVASHLAARSYNLQNQGRHDEAVKLLAASLGLLDGLLESQPTRLDVRRTWIETSNRLAFTFLKQGRREDAEEQFRASLRRASDALAIWKDTPPFTRLQITTATSVAKVMFTYPERRADAHAQLDVAESASRRAAELATPGAALNEICAAVHLTRAMFHAVEGDAPAARRELEAYDVRFAHALTFTAKDGVYLARSPLTYVILAESHLVEGDEAAAAEALRHIRRPDEQFFHDFPRLMERRTTPPFDALIPAPSR